MAIINNSNKGIFNQERTAYKPFQYPWAYEAYKAQNSMHWIPDEITFEEDKRDWDKRLTEDEKSFLTQIFRFFTQGDIDVAGAYIERFMPTFKHPELRMMMSSFAAMEAVHIDAYSQLMDTVGMADSEYEAFLEYEEMANKHEYITDLKDNVSATSLAKQIAVFSAFTEGLQLFSSFVMLLNFPRQGKMKGMGKVIEWSVRDECYSDDTDILTENGFKLFKDLQPNERVAQYNQETGEISYVVPSRYVQNDDHKELIHFYNEKGGVDLLVTPNHGMPYTYRDTKAGTVQHCKLNASEFKPSYRNKLPVSGHSTAIGREFTAEDALLVALQADGSIPKGEYRNGNHSGYRRCTFSFAKKRKIDRLAELAKASDWDYHISYGKDSRGQSNSTLDVPKGLATKLFRDWVNPSEVSAEWAASFIEELIHWDGHDVEGKGETIYYSSTEEDNVSLIQELCVVAGYKASRSVQGDSRKDTYKDVHRMWLKRNVTEVPTGAVKKEVVPYNGTVYCVTVPEGNIVTRRNGRVCISGNSLHVESMIKLFQEIIREYPEIWTDEFKGELYQVCRDMVELEDKFIDLAFEEGGIEGLTPEEVKEFIRHIADRRLLQLGLKPNYGIKDNPLPWYDEMLSAVTHTNFFENRVTEYSKGTLKGEWE